MADRPETLAVHAGEEEADPASEEHALPIYPPSIGIEKADGTMADLEQALAASK